MKYFDSGYTISDQYRLFNCYGPIGLNSLYETRCIGTCPQSPTKAPTNAPSLSPSGQTVSPSFVPTVAPTIAPSLAPSDTPSTSPTSVPTFGPSMAPSITPTYSPSKAPSQTPSTAPSATPTYSPSIAPTLSPSLTPSQSPSMAPSITPSLSPSLSPSYFPTTAPTQNPIASKDFDSFIAISYYLKNVNTENKLRITTHVQNETMYIKSVITQQYFLPSVISYKNFLVNMVDIQGTKIEDIDVNTNVEWTNLNSLELNAKIECNINDDNVNYCASIQQQSKEDNAFYDRVTEELRRHYNTAKLNSNKDVSLIKFVAGNGNSLQIQCKVCEKESSPAYMLYGLAAVVGLLFLLAIFALLFNKRKFPKLPGFNMVDDAEWTALMIYSLQLWYGVFYLSPFFQFYQCL